MLKRLNFYETLDSCGDRVVYGVSDGSGVVSAVRAPLTDRGLTALLRTIQESVNALVDEAEVLRTEVRDLTRRVQEVERGFQVLGPVTVGPLAAFHANVEELARVVQAGLSARTLVLTGDV